MQKLIYSVLPVSLTLLIVLFLAQSSRVASLSSPDSLQTSVFVTSTITETQKLIASDGMSRDEFGVQVAIDGDTAAISSYFSDIDGVDDQGAAYVFQNGFSAPGQWDEVTKLVADDGQSFDFFGIRIAVEGDLILVGAPFSNLTNIEEPGAAYVYQRDTGGQDNWGQVDKLLASDGIDGAEFGFGVSISEDTIAIGAPAEDQYVIARQGQVYIFEPHPTIPNKWEEVQILAASDAVNNDWFGISVSMDGNLMVVGAKAAAYIFAYNDVIQKWEEVRKLTVTDTSDMQMSDWFGNYVAISQDIVVVGDQDAKFNGVTQGSAFVFSQNEGGVDNWGLVKVLTAESATEFGISLDIDADLITVSGNGTPTYVYQRNKGGLNNWGEIAQLIPSNEITGTDFGIGSGISGETVLVGARHTDDKGAAYIYELEICCQQYLPFIQK